jgi:hypothetical protein
LDLLLCIRGGEVLNSHHRGAPTLPPGSPLPSVY